METSTAAEPSPPFFTTGFNVHRQRLERHHLWVLGSQNSLI
jgi:hypothetical protein